MATRKIKKIKTAPIRNPDAGRIWILAFAIIFLGATAFVFIRFADSMISRSESADAPQPSRHVVESLVFHYDQLPGDFPDELIKDRIGSVASSQQIIDSRSGVLKFVSFKSALPKEELLNFYGDYFYRKVFAYDIGNIGLGGAFLSAQRSSMNFDLAIHPESEGSTVSIYYLIEK